MLFGEESKKKTTTEVMNARIKQKYVERMQRTYNILQNYNSSLADEVFQDFKVKDDIHSMSAVKIQKVFKGYLARKKFEEILCQYYIEVEEKAFNQERLKMEQGLIMLENIQLEEKIREKQFLLKQKEIERNWAATVIQRKFRIHKKEIEKSHDS